MTERQSNKRQIYIYIVMLLACMFLALMPIGSVRAASATDVEIAAVDYDALTLAIVPNGNAVVYYSTDKKTWDEVEYYISGTNWIMDISWISATKETTVYFKGDRTSKVVSATFPKRNTSFKVVFNKSDGDVTITNYDDATYFQWRKSTDYSWNIVSLTENSATYLAFINQLEDFRVKGAKLIFRTVQTQGTSVNDMGTRPSKEVTVSITKRANAPTIKVNTVKLTLNTTTAMEYSANDGETWIECDKAMTVETIAPEVISSGSNVSLMIRTAATENKPYSKTTYLTIPGQIAAPVDGDAAADLSYYYTNGKLTLKFNLATATQMYEYTIIKPDVEFDEIKARWKTVKASKTITVSNSSAPEGSTVYFRKRGIAANASKGIELVLPSAMDSFTVSY